MNEHTTVNKRQIMIIILLVLFSPLAIDIYLPAFPEMAVAFAVDRVIIQDSMTWFMLSVGTGQLVAGPLADRFGRRPIALYGIAIYALSATLISITQNFNIMLISRLLQGVGACACSVAAFTAVRDCFGANKSTQMISYLNAIICLINLSSG